MAKAFVFTVLLTASAVIHLLGQRSPLPKDNSDRILRFASDIDVLTTGKLHVIENITVFNGDGSSGTNNYGEMVASHNNEIQRGIFREFPTRYKDSTGYFTDRGFRLRSVQKDGSPEPYAIENMNNGVRIRIGDKNLTLPTGVIRYTIEYETDRQLLFLPGKDELYWNVNGSGWAFTADSISCLIHFPDGAVIGNHICYTGVQGAIEHDCKATLMRDNAISFATSRQLGAHEGLTVAVDIQKGIIHPPGSIDNAIAFLRSNYIIPALSAIIIFLFTFYYITWSRKGRDPQKGVIYPQFSPPQGLSPADCGYILEQRERPHLFTAALVDCAVKKQLQIAISREGLLFKTNVYHFNQAPGVPIDPTVTQPYGFDIRTLYGEEAKKGTYNSTLKACSDALSVALRDRFLVRRGKQNKMYGLFSLNKGYTQFGLVVILASAFLAFQFLIQHLSLKLTVIVGVMFVLLLLIHNVFVRIMSAYTRQGRDVADHLLGFRMYLETTEKHVYDQLTPPEKTLELFEKYLPYAIALKVENAWAEKFEGIMQNALEQGYTPSYFGLQGGGYHSFSMSDMSHDLSSGLSSTVSSASSPPSSSGSSGGSSGGGGGGGGGGGW